MKFFLNCLFVLFISSISRAQCPVIGGAMVNACGTNEGLNEFVLFTTTAAATAGDYTLYYGDNSIPSLGLPVNILAGANATSPSGTGTITSTNGCIINQVTSAATAIPANSIVLFIPSNFDVNYDVTAICASSTIYVVYIDITTLPSVWNAAGVFANNSFTTGYLQISNGATNCASEIRSYNNNWPTDIDGNAVWWDNIGNDNYSNNGCSIIAPAVTISNVMPTPVCVGSTSTSAPYTTSGNPNTYTLVWDAAASAAGFVDITNAPLTGSPLLISIPAAAAAATYTASLVVKNTISGNSSVAQIFSLIINPQVIPIFNPIAAICNGAIAPVLPTTSVNGITGTWSPTTVSNTASGTYIFTPSAGACATTTSLTVTVQAQPTAFLLGTTTSCYGTSTNIVINGTPNATVSYNINGGAVQTATLSGLGRKIINSGVLTTNLTYNLISITSAGLPGCTQPLSASAVVTVLPLVMAAISGTTSICSGSATNITFTGTPNATVSYSINGGPIQAILLDATGNASLSTGNLTSNATYRLVSVINAGLPACLHVISGTAVITVVPLPTVSISGTTTICSGAATNIFFSGTPNATVTFNINGGANQTIVLDGTGNASVSTGSLTSDVAYNLVSVLNAGVPACLNPISGTAVVSVTPLPVAAISGTTTICSSNSANINFTGTPLATVTYNINNGTNQTIILDTTGAASVNTGNLTANASYNLVSALNAGLPACLNTITGTAVVTVLPIPTASINGTTAICNGTSTNVSFTGTPNAIVTYNVDGNTPFQTISLDAFGAAILNTGNLSISSTYNLVSVANPGSVSCLQTLTGSAVITVYPVTGVPLVTPTVIYCQNEITIPLNATGNSLLWYTTATGGTGSATAPTPVSTTAGTVIYYVTQTLNSCESVKVPITVVVYPTPVTPSVPLIAVYRCGSGPVALKATAPGIVKWYSDAALTTFLIAAPTYTPTISATTTFYVTNTENGCVSASRAVVATVFPLVVQVTGFSYSPSTICDGSPNAVPVPVTGFVLGGVYSSTPGLSINKITGVINPAASIPGTYTIKYSIGAAICTLAANSTTTITINKSKAPVTTFSYSSPVCTSAANPSPVTAAGFVAGGIYSSTGGLSINAATGVIDLSTSSGGTYTVTYTLGATACTTIGISATTITIVAPQAPTLTGSAPRCGSGTMSLSAAALGSIKWYGDAGLTNLLYTGNAFAPTVNSTTTFYVTNTEGLCISPQASVVATVIPTTTQVTTFSYNPSTVCAGSPAPVPITIAGFVPGGIYSSSDGLSLNTSTGVIDPSTSTPGTYIVKYDVAGYQCVLPGSSTSSISISKTTTSETTFSYLSPVCASAADPAPSHSAGFTMGGIFSSSSGLVIDAATGMIDLKASTPGQYQVTYTVTSSPCTTGGNSTADIVINTVPIAPVTKGGQRCGGGTITLDATASGTITWYKTIDLKSAVATGSVYTAAVTGTTDFYVTASNGNCESESTVVTANILPLPIKPDLGKTNTLCDGDTILLNPGSYDNYLWQNNSTAPIQIVTTPGVYSLIVKSFNGCTNATSISIGPSNTCSDILFPTAFSPNGDQLNDSFGPLPYRNLGFVTHYSFRIFNRYGQVVFSTDNPYQKWDGTFKGEMNNTGTFMWRAEYIYSNGSLKSQKGNVVIVH